MNRTDLLYILSTKNPSEIENVRKKVEDTLLKYCGKKVYYRGLIEFSNICVNDCYYCGIRKGNAKVNRYCLPLEEIVSAAAWCAEQGYGSIVWQSGERQDSAFVDFVEAAVKAIRSETVSDKMPKGLGVTLCVGEQSEAVYNKFYTAGAHRYLLRIETSNKKLFEKIHPAHQKFETRVEALRALKRAGFQVGTGVMIGLPGQSVEELADDLLFFKVMDVDMIGMGPYIAHNDTPLAARSNASDRTPDGRFGLALRMIAAARLLLKDVNIAATTALQALDPQGREQGLLWGANIIMPQLTPAGVRRDYLLYEGKPCLDESAEQCRSCLEQRIKAIGREVGYFEWGDSRHFKNNNQYRGI